MPEGPEVRIHSEQLHKLLKNKVIHSIHVDNRSKFAKARGLLHFHKIRERLPKKVLQVYPYGKKIIIELENNHYLISSLGMAGFWTFDKSNHTNLWIIYDNQQILYFDDVRHFGLFEICLSTDELNQRLSDIGPDLLNTNVSYITFKNQLMKSPNKPLCELLMEQKYLSGIGNYLKSEILYQSKIRPDRSPQSLNNDEFKLLYTNSINLIHSAYKSQGMNAYHQDLYGNKGSFKVLVYQQKYDPYGNKVEKMKCKDNRTTFWVPIIQK